MIYFIEAVGVGHIKIGFTDGDDAALRLADLQTGSPVPLRLLGTLPGTLEAEKDLHRRFAAARVHGEWFKPVAELIALVPAVEVISCDGVEIVEQSVSIRVLTVGRKQFSKTLLGQLPTRCCIHWDAVLDFAKTNPDAINGHALAEHTYGDVWGWVKGEVMEAYLPDHDHVGPVRFRWIIFVEEGRLFKHADVCNVASMHQYQTQPLRGQMRLMLKTLYDSRLSLPGWRNEDQLFFGV